MKKVSHPVYGECYELTHKNDIVFTNVAQAALVNQTTFPSGAKSPAKNLWIREKYLVPEAHRPEGGPLP